MSSPKLDTAPEPAKATLEQVQQRTAGPVALAGRTSQLSAVGRYLGNRRFSSLLTGGEQSEFDIAFAEVSSPLQSTAMQTIEGKTALGTRAEVQLLWEPYSGEAFWPLGAGEWTRSGGLQRDQSGPWMDSIARESSYNKRYGTAPSAGNDLLVCKLAPGGGVQVFKVIVNEQKAVDNREFLQTTAISSSLVKNVGHNIELLEKREAAAGVQPEAREVLLRSNEVLKATQAALADPTGKTPLPEKIQFELTSMGGAGDQFGIGNEESHLRILARTFGKQGAQGRLLEDIIDHTVVRDRALAARLRAAGVLDPAATDPDVVPMRLLLTPQANAWLALRSGLTPEQWLKQAEKEAKASAGKAAYDSKKAEELERLQKQALGSGKSKKLSPAQLEKQAEKAAKQAQKDAVKQFSSKAFKRQTFDSTGSVVDSLAPAAARPVANIGELETQAKAALVAREAAEAEAAEPGASRTATSLQRLLLAKNTEMAARLALADARAELSGKKADAEAANKVRAEFEASARVLNEMGEVNRRVLEASATAEAAPRSAQLAPNRNVIVEEQARGHAKAAGALEIALLLARGADETAAHRDVRRSSALRTWAWWYEKGVLPSARVVVDRWLDSDESTAVLPQALLSMESFDGLEVDGLTQPEQFAQFAAWARATLHTFDDYIQYFVRVLDPGVRRNGSSWEVQVWRWDDDWPAASFSEWQVDARVTELMEPIYQQMMAQTVRDIGDTAEQRKSPPIGRVVGRRWLRHVFGTSKALYSPTEPGVAMILNALVDTDFEPVFLLLEGTDTPAGKSLVMGGDLLTHVLLRQTQIWIADERPTVSRSGRRSSELRPNTRAIAFVETDALTDADPRSRQ